MGVWIGLVQLTVTLPVTLLLGQCDRCLHFYVVFLTACHTVKQQGAPILDIFISNISNRPYIDIKVKLSKDRGENCVTV